MISRVTENSKFSMLNGSMSRVTSQYSALMEKISTQKNINRPSDDPIGTNDILDFRSSKAAIEQYKKNINNANSWVSLVETNLSSIGNIIINASELAVSQASGTASADSRKSAAETLSPLIDEIRSLANAKYGDRYLFGGSKTDAEPFSAEYGPAHIGVATAASGNTYGGIVTAGGTFTVTPAANTTYAVKIVDAGTLLNLSDATYQVSDDSGKTWGAVQTDMSGPVDVGNGVTLSFTAAPLKADDLFQVTAYAAGYYHGNNDLMTVEIGKNNNLIYNISGGDIFTTQTGGDADLFQHLNDLKNALENNDASGIAAQIDTLKAAQTQVTQYQAACGSKINSLETTQSSHEDLDLQITSMMSQIEDADITKLITEFQMKQIAMQASYSMSAQIGKLTILDYLR